MLKLYINQESVEYKSFIFSGGEIQVKVPSPPLSAEWLYKPCSIQITAHLRNSDDVMELLMLTDAIRRSYEVLTFDVLIPYFPYARQDRVCAPGEALAVKVMADLINSQNYDSVILWDPHSDVTPALLNNCKVVKSTILLDSILREAKLDKENTILVSPDAGANKRIFDIAATIHFPHVVRADKQRDVNTGALSGTEVYGDVQGKTCLIIDDLADGAGTFLLLGQKLKEKGAKKVVLYVTHGIFSKGIDFLEGAIDEIYCPNLWKNNVENTNSKGILKTPINKIYYGK